MEQTEKTVKGYMLMVVEQHIDNIGDVNMTSLAEDSYDTFNNGADVPEEYFDWACDIACEVSRTK